MSNKISVKVDEKNECIIIRGGLFRTPVIYSGAYYEMYVTAKSMGTYREKLVIESFINDSGVKERKVG